MPIVGTRSMFLAALLLGIALVVVFAAPISATERISDLVATPEYDQAELKWNIALSWTDPDGSTDSTDILRRVQGQDDAGEFTTIATVAAGETSYLDDSGIQSRTTYIYRTERKSDSRKSNAASAKLPKVPSLPAGVNSSASPDGITVSWDPPDRGNVANFEVHRQSASQTSYGLVETVEATGTSFFDNDIQFGMPYNYRVTAVNVHGSSVGTVPVSAAVRPPAPTNFRLDTDDSVTYEQLHNKHWVSST